MKILLISNMYPDKKYPSYGVFVRNTENILKDAGFHVKRIIMHKETRKYIKLFKYMGYYAKILINGLFTGYDVIYVHYASHNALPLLILKTLKRKVEIYTNVHGSDIVPETRFSQKLQVYVKRLLLKSDKIIAPSQYYKDLICSKYGTEKNKVFVFPSGGIDGRIFHIVNDKGKLFSQLSLDSSMKYIGYVGRIDYKKGWDIFLDALGKLKSDGFLNDKRAIVVGSGKQMAEFNKKVEQLGLKDYIIHFDLLHQEKLKYIYNCLEVFCFPTMREGESLGLVGLEAMACGVPVIGSSMGGLLDYIKDEENGLFFEPGNVNMLGEKIVEYFSMGTEKKQNMKYKAAATSERYKVDKIKNILVDIFTRQ